MMLLVHAIYYEGEVKQEYLRYAHGILWTREKCMIRIIDSDSDDELTEVHCARVLDANGNQVFSFGAWPQ